MPVLLVGRPSPTASCSERPAPAAIPRRPTIPGLRVRHQRLSERDAAIAGGHLPVQRHREVRCQLREHALGEPGVLEAPARQHDRIPAVRPGHRAARFRPWPPPACCETAPKSPPAGRPAIRSPTIALTVGRRSITHGAVCIVELPSIAATLAADRPPGSIPARSVPRTARPPGSATARRRRRSTVPPRGPAARCTRPAHHLPHHPDILVRRPSETTGWRRAAGRRRTRRSAAPAPSATAA